MSTTQPSFIKSPDSITIAFVNGSGDTATIYASDPRWDDINAAVREHRWEDAYDIAFPSSVIQEWLNSYDITNRVTIDSGVVYFNDHPMHNTLTTRMLEMLQDGFDIVPMAKFLDNLMDNPSFRAINELYDFLEASKLPITEDGHFLAYKRVRSNYTDCHSGKFDNSVGAVCEMPRNMVDEDKDRTCSQGLHFCGREYLGFYGTGPSHRSMVVKINPADVVAIPSDHNNMKGRAARYIVVDELEHSNETELEGAFRHSPGFIDDAIEFDEDVEEWIDDDDGEEDAFDEDPLRDWANTDVLSNIDQYPEAVLQLHTGNASPQNRVVSWYRTPRDAFMKTGIYNIRRVANGERKTAGGFEWVWANNTPLSGRPDPIRHHEHQHWLQRLLNGGLG